jgi:teichuronic acid exporter
MSLAQKAGQAGALMLIRKVWGALISFGVMAYLARELSKEDFGIVAISATLISLIQVIAISGISEYLIFYKGEDEKKVMNAGFWFNLIATIIVSLLVIVATPYWSSFYGDERISKIIYLMLIGFFFSMLSAIPMALFRKNLDYRPMIFIQTVFGTVSNMSQIGFAFYGFGVYSLALPNAIIAPIMTLALFWRSGFVPSSDLGLHYWKNIVRYTKHVIGQRILGKIVNEGDTLIIGKFFGMQVLGVYNLAFQFANLFTAHFLPIITNISMPVFAKNNKRPELVTQHYHKMVRLLSFITIPVIAFMILNADFLISTIYGAKWIDAILPFQILSIFVMVRSIGSPTSGLYNAMGKPQIGFYFTLIFTPIFLTTIYVSSLFNNLIVMVVMISAIRALGSFTHFIIAAKLLGDKLMTVIHIMVPVCTSVGIAYVASMFIPHAPEVFLLFRTLVYIVISWLLLKYIWPREFNIFTADLFSMLPVRVQKWIPSVLL